MHHNCQPAIPLNVNNISIIIILIYISQCFSVGGRLVSRLLKIYQCRHKTVAEPATRRCATAPVPAATAGITELARVTTHRVRCTAQGPRALCGVRAHPLVPPEIFLRSDDWQVVAVLQARCDEAVPASSPCTAKHASVTVRMARGSTARVWTG